MNGMGTLDGLAFDDHPTSDAQIELQIVPDTVSAVDDWNATLDLHWNPSHRQLDHQTVAIDRFEEARSQRTVNRHGAPYDQFCQIINRRRWSLHGGCGQHKPRLPIGGALWIMSVKSPQFLHQVRGAGTQEMQGVAYLLLSS